MEVENMDSSALQSLVNADDPFQIRAASTTPARQNVAAFRALKHSAITDTKLSLAQEPQSNEYELRARVPKDDESRAFESVQDSKESEPSILAPDNIPRKEKDKELDPGA